MSLHFKYYSFVYIINSSRTGAILAPREHLMMSGDIFGYDSWQRGATRNWRVEARGAPKHPHCTGQPPQQRTTWPQMSTELRWRNLGIVKCWNLKTFTNTSCNIFHRPAPKNKPTIPKRLTHMTQYSLTLFLRPSELRRLLFAQVFPSADNEVTWSNIVT